MTAVTLNHLQRMKASGEKATCLTAYDATFAHVAAAAGVDMLLVGDSLGMVIQGHGTTVPVSMEDMLYHVRAVRSGVDMAERKPWIIGDMPFMSYATPTQLLSNAARLIQAGAQMVKVEGGAWLLDGIRQLSDRGITVCGHLGLTPQSVDALGGYRVQGKQDEDARRILKDAEDLQEAGARMLVLECVPRALAKTITERLQIPVIGIGAGPDTDAQVLVLHDMLGITPGFKARFVKNFMHEASSIPEAIEAYVAAVKNGAFPADEHCF
jgi:3-methyl-2-oxobutanoate hydroxymethyltransferase